MTVFRRAAQRDLNEPEIVKALRDAGAVVYLMPKPVDLLVGFRGTTYLIEVKRHNPDGGSHGLTKDQKTFFELWYGDGGIVACVSSAQEALEVIGAI